MHADTDTTRRSDLGVVLLTMITRTQIRFMIVPAAVTASITFVLLHAFLMEQAFGFVVAADYGRPMTRSSSNNLLHVGSRCSSKRCSSNMDDDDECCSCVEWVSYTFEEQPTGGFPANVVGTKRQIACRVLINKNNDKEQQHYYEFGTVDLDNNDSPLVCTLHSTHDKQIHEDFEIAVKNEAYCGDSFHWAPMAFDVDPLGPNIVNVGRATLKEEEASSDFGICKYKDVENQKEYLGRMFLQGRYFGHCGYLQKKAKQEEELVFVGGNFHVLNAIPQVNNKANESKFDNDDNYQIRRSKLLDDIQKRIHLYLSAQDKHLIQSISGHSVEELVQDLSNTEITSNEVLSRVLSMDRFIPHDVLNTKGLSILRAVLAEQMTRARRRKLGLHHHPDTVIWERDGVLLKDFDYYTDKHNQQEFQELLQMVAASKSLENVANFAWVERNVASVANDPQREPHIDTFHSVVKMWVYEKGIVTNATGPLHFSKGSNRNTRGKLEWIYNVTLPPATEAIKEPSLRFRGDATMMENDMDILRPVLPLDKYHRTLVIADTSGIHHRGIAVPGTVRKTIRLSSGNDGGLPRLNPFAWDGWDDRQETKQQEEMPPEGLAECAEAAS